MGSLLDGTRWLKLSSIDRALCLTSDDAFDALVAALVARAAAVDLVEEVPEEEREAARREGWIALPRAGSLAGLARATPTC